MINHQLESSDVFSRRQKIPVYPHPNYPWYLSCIYDVCPKISLVCFLMKIHYAFWQSHVAIEHTPFIDGFPIPVKHPLTGDFPASHGLP